MFGECIPRVYNPIIEKILGARERHMGFEKFETVITSSRQGIREKFVEVKVNKMVNYFVR